jgi:structural maintenance of chromosome 4
MFFPGIKLIFFIKEIIDDCEEGTPIEGSDFYVSRTASRDNSSFYEINGKRVQFKEVSLLLRQKGIDLDHNRFLILQGEVEQIAQMKPKGSNPNDTGMLEYLEDIIGSSRFQEPIEILSNAVNELDDLRGEKLARVKLVEKEKDDLEGPRNKAICFIKLENEVIHYYILQFTIQIIIAHGRLLRKTTVCVSCTCTSVPRKLLKF